MHEWMSCNLNIECMKLKLCTLHFRMLKVDLTDLKIQPTQLLQWGKINKVAPDNLLSSGQLMSLWESTYVYARRMNRVEQRKFL